MKKVIPLNDSWLYGKGFSKSCLEQDFDFGAFFPVSLPHNNTRLEADYFDADKMQFVSTYTRLLLLDEKYNGSKLKLCFDGIISYAEVYVNGMFVTSHKGDTPFTADITAPVKYGFENRIVLKVDSRIKKEVPSSGVNGPMLSYGGIHRQVWLNVVNGGEIADAFVRTPRVCEAVSDVEIAVTLGDFYPDTFLEAVVLDGEGKRAGALSAKAVLGREVTLTGSVEDVRLWSEADPALYRAIITLKNADSVMDVKQVDFGFRNAVFKRDGFYLNNRRVKLIGLNRMDCYPIIGRAASEHLQRMDARILKNELGCNVVRTHGLASRYFIDECNKLGLMVIADISGDGYIGAGSWRDALVENIADMVRRDRNDPAVIAWGVRVNNSRDCDELYFKTNKAARDNDGTRATLGTRSFMGSRMYEDVFAFNDYPEGKTLSRLGKTSKLFVPYFISEHTGRTYPTKSCDNEARRTEQARRHLAVIDKVLGHKKITGCAGMAFADFNCAKTQGGGDSVLHYGVLDQFRCKKTAAHAYAALQDGAPVLESSSTLMPDEFTGRLYLYTNCDSVKLYRDDCLVGEFFPAKKYGHLPHAPVIIDDCIGRFAQESDKLTLLQSRLLKYVVKNVKKRGGLYNLSAPARFAAGILRRMLRADAETFKKLTDKYVSAPAVFRAEGIRGGETVIQKTIGGGGNEGNHLVLKASATTVSPSSGYETVLITAESADRAGNTLFYDFSPLKIDTDGELRLVGDSVLSLNGGRAGFFVTTTPYDGKAKVTVSSRWGTETVDLEVRHERVEKL